MYIVHHIYSEEFNFLPRAYSNMISIMPLVMIGHIYLVHLVHVDHSFRSDYGDINVGYLQDIFLEMDEYLFLKRHCGVWLKSYGSGGTRFAVSRK